VAALSVVVLQPGGKGLGSLVVAGEDLPVGPFGGEGAIEAFDSAVLPGAVGSDELLGDPELVAEGWQVGAVGPGVVGHESFDPGDAGGGEVGDGAGEEPVIGGTFLVGQDPEVCESGVVVDEGVDVVVADTGVAPA